MLSDRTGVANSILLVMAVLLFVAVFSRIMTEELDHDEHMYISAGALMAQGERLYTDFAYLQMPYMPCVYAAAFKLTGTTHYLLTGRLVKVCIITVSCLLLFGVSMMLNGSKLFSFLAVLLFCLNEIMYFTMARARNHDLPLCLVLLAFLLHTASDRKSGVSSRLLFFSGLSVGFTIGVKLTYALIPFPFIAVGLMFPAELTFRERIRMAVAPFIAGVALALLPVLYFMMKSGVTVFMFNNLGYHHYNTLWRGLWGYQSTMTLSAKLLFSVRMLALPGNLILTALLIYLAFLFAKQLRAGAKPFSRNMFSAITTTALLLGIGLVSALLPTPSQNGYFAMPVTAAILLLIGLFSGLKDNRQLFLRCMVVALCVMSLIGGLRLFRDSTNAVHPGRWTGNSVHAVAQNIKTAMPEITEDPVVATLSPLFALESGLPVYRELSTGSFMYRIAGLLTDSQQQLFHAVSETSLSTLLDARPPSVIVTGWEGTLDNAFTDYANLHGYTQINGDFDACTVFVRDASTR